MLAVQVAVLLETISCESARARANTHSQASAYIIVISIYAILRDVVHVTLQSKCAQMILSWRSLKTSVILRLSIHVPMCSAIFGTQQVAFKEQISTKQLTLDVHIVNVEKKITKLIEAI